MPEDAAGLFTPVPNDYAIRMLRLIFGSVVDGLLGTAGGGQAGGATGDGSALITSVIGTFNLAVLAFAVVVGTYLIYATVFDTAKDGETLGRETDTRYTFLRAGIGAVLLLPVSGGFTLAQLAVLQSLVWSSAVGDRMWSRAATHLAQASTGYLAAAPGAGADDFVTAGKLADAMHARLLGHLCALHANEIARRVLARDATALEPRRRRRAMVYSAGAANGDPGDVMTEYYFAAGTSYDNRSSMCGSVSMNYTTPGSQALSGTFLDGVRTYAENLDVLARDAVQRSGEAAFDAVDAAAREIARSIHDNGRDTEAFKARIEAAVLEATARFRNGVQVMGGAQASQLSRSLLQLSTDDGWVFAAVWQRALSSFAFKASDARDRLSFGVSDAVDPKAAGSTSCRYLSWAGACNATERTLFDAADRDFAYVGVLEGAFAQVRDPVRAAGTTLERLTAANRDAGVIAPVQWLYRNLFSTVSTGNGSAWVDPLIAIQQQGKNFLYAGTALSAIGAAGPTLGAVAGAFAGPAGGRAGAMAGDAVSRIASPLGWVFLGLGFVATAFLPFMPFAYYLSGVVAWFATAVEAMAAASMWCLLALAPSRGGDLLGTNRQGLLLLLAVFLRPALMVLGLIACYVLMSVGVRLLNVTSAAVFMIMAPDWSIANVFIAAGLLVAHVVLLYSVAMNCCALITGVGDAVMEWINVRASALGRNGIAEDLARNVNPQGRATGDLMDLPSRTRQALNAPVHQPNERALNYGRAALRRLKRP